MSSRTRPEAYTEVTRYHQNAIFIKLVRMWNKMGCDSAGLIESMSWCRVNGLTNENITKGRRESDVNISQNISNK